MSEEQYGQTNSIYESIFLKFGKFDQSDRRFSSETRGNQCISPLKL
jgi:hypothetical protein